MYTLRDVCRRDSGESYTCARPTGQRGLRTPAFGADTVTGREEPVRHVVRGPFGSLGPRPARPAVNIHSFTPKLGSWGQIGGVFTGLQRIGLGGSIH